MEPIAFPPPQCQRKLKHPNIGLDQVKICHNQQAKLHDKIYFYRIYLDCNDQLKDIF